MLLFLWRCPQKRKPKVEVEEINMSATQVVTKKIGVENRESREKRNRKRNEEENERAAEIAKKERVGNGKRGATTPIQIKVIGRGRRGRKNHLKKSKRMTGSAPSRKVVLCPRQRFRVVTTTATTEASLRLPVAMKVIPALEAGKGGFPQVRTRAVLGLDPRVVPEANQDPSRKVGLDPDRKAAQGVDLGRSPRVGRVPDRKVDLEVGLGLGLKADREADRGRSQNRGLGLDLSQALEVNLGQGVSLNQGVGLGQEVSLDQGVNRKAGLDLDPRVAQGASRGLGLKVGLDLPQEVAQIVRQDPGVGQIEFLLCYRFLIQQNHCKELFRSLLTLRLINIDYHIFIYVI